MKIRIKARELGTLDAEGTMSKLKRSGDYVVVTVAVDSITRYDLNTSLALTYKDLIQLVGLFIKSKLLLFLITGIRNRNNPRPLPRKW